MGESASHNVDEIHGGHFMRRRRTWRASRGQRVVRRERKQVA